MKRKYIIPIFIPHKGCPNACVFCNQKKISGAKGDIDINEVRKTIESYLENFENVDMEIEIAFFGGSFTAIDQDEQEALLEVANEYIKMKKVDSIRISTRPDCIDKNILKFLKKYKVKTIELGVQSAVDDVLKNSKRGHDFESVKKASKLIKQHRFVLGHQMMVGLPDSSRRDEMNTAMELCKLKPKLMRIYPVLVIKNTELETMYKNGEYTPLTLEQAIDRVKELFYIFDKKNIEIIRVGLQNTDTIKNPKEDNSDVVAGPYHEAFRQLVEASIWYDAIVTKIKSIPTITKKIEIRVNPENVNNVIGHKKENIKKVKELYDVSVKVVGDPKIKPEKIQLEISENYTDFLDGDAKSNKKANMKMFK